MATKNQLYKDPLDVALNALKYVSQYAKEQQKYNDVTKMILEYVKENKQEPVVKSVPRPNEKEEIYEFSEEELIVDVDTKLYKEYNMFFKKNESYLASNLSLFLKKTNSLNKLATVGDNPWDAFKNADDAKNKGAFVIKTSEEKSIKVKSQTISIDFETKKSLMSISTDFVTKQFLIDKSKYFHFIVKSFYLFITMLQNNFDFTNKLEFKIIMKGGNLLKFLFEVINTKLNTKLSNWIKMEFGEYFDYSDFDFDFKIVKLDNMMSETEYYRIRAMIINLINLYIILIKNILLENKEYFFDFYSGCEQSRKDKLQNYIVALNKGFLKIIEEDMTKETREYTFLDDYIIDGVVFYYNNTTNKHSYYDAITNEIHEQTLDSAILSKMNDFMIVNGYDAVGKNTHTTTTINIDFNDYFRNILNLGNEFNHIFEVVNKHSFFYNTCNANLQFKVLNSGVIEFSLMRIKMQFAVKLRLKNNINSYYIRLPGELLDVSSPRLNDYKTLTSVPENYEKIFSKDIHFPIMVQSYQGLIVELMNILFTETGNMPWDDAKYAKRVNRLHLILVLRLLLIEPNISDINKIRFMEALYKNIKDNMNYASSQSEINYFRPNNDVSLLFTKYFKAYYDYIIGVILNKNTNKFKFDEFKKVLLDIIDKCIRILRTQYQYINKKGEFYEVNYYYGFI